MKTSYLALLRISCARPWPSPSPRTLGLITASIVTNTIISTNAPPVIRKTSFVPVNSRESLNRMPSTTKKRECKEA